MRNASPDTAQVLVLPPLVYGGVFVMGLLLHLVFPLHVLPTTLVRGIGVVCVLVSCPLALLTLRALFRAHTPVDPMNPLAMRVACCGVCDHTARGAATMHALELLARQAAAPATPSHAG